MQYIPVFRYVSMRYSSHSGRIMAIHEIAWHAKQTEMMYPWDTRKIWIKSILFMGYLDVLPEYWGYFNLPLGFPSMLICTRTNRLRMWFNIWSQLVLISTKQIQSMSGLLFIMQQIKIVFNWSVSYWSPMQTSISWPTRIQLPWC